jgi:hypothetical protein
MLSVVVFFRGSPPTPPSEAAASHKENFKLSLKMMAKNRYFLKRKLLTFTRAFTLLFLAFGTTTGAFYAVSTVLDQLVTKEGFSSVKMNFPRNF